jgi:hypothetical protein
LNSMTHTKRVAAHAGPWTKDGQRAKEMRDGCGGRGIGISCGFEWQFIKIASSYFLRSFHRYRSLLRSSRVPCCSDADVC